MRKKELIVCLIGILLLTLVIVNQAFATSGVDITQANLSGNIANNTNNNTMIRETNSSNNTNNTSNTSNTSNTANNTTNNRANNTNTNISKNDGATNSDKLADTGLESTSIFIILVFVISAIYAYKKIREYNV